MFGVIQNKIYITVDVYNNANIILYYHRTEYIATVVKYNKTQVLVYTFSYTNYGQMYSSSSTARYTNKV